ncbi:MAG: polyisoprenoid-binding protein [Balneolaceae bacterium]|nr:polyisoprenoid-binding protein [Balneolaceae bacterium]
MKATIKTLSIFVALFFAAAPIMAQDATAWTVDKSHSSIKFEVRHFFSNVPGAFHEYDANIHFDPNNLDDSKLDVTIQVASVDTENERRDGHLRTPDFFNAEEWPTMSFTSNSIEKVGDNQFVAKGELTIKDVTKDFEMPFTLLGVMDHPRREGVKIAGFSSEFMLKRNDFGVGTGDYISDAVIGNEVNVKLNVEVNSNPSSSSSN